MDNVRVEPRQGIVGSEQHITVAERELRSFVGSVIDLFGSEGVKFLEDIWLDELAEMEWAPEPTSPQWRLVSIAASSRLEGRLIASSMIEDTDSPMRFDNRPSHLSS